MIDQVNASRAAAHLHRAMYYLRFGNADLQFVTPHHDASELQVYDATNPHAQVPFHTQHPKGGSCTHTDGKIKIPCQKSCCAFSLINNAVGWNAFDRCLAIDQAAYKNRWFQRLDEKRRKTFIDKTHGEQRGLSMLATQYIMEDIGFEFLKSWKVNELAETSDGALATATSHQMMGNGRVNWGSFERFMTCTLGNKGANNIALNLERMENGKRHRHSALLKLYKGNEWWFHCSQRQNAIQLNEHNWNKFVDNHRYVLIVTQSFRCRSPCPLAEHLLPLHHISTEDDSHTPSLKKHARRFSPY